jgi:hypothetical protein
MPRPPEAARRARQRRVSTYGWPDPVRSGRTLLLGPRAWMVVGALSGLIILAAILVGR